MTVEKSTKFDEYSIPKTLTIKIDSSFSRKWLVRKILTNQSAVVKFVRLLHHQKLCTTWDALNYVARFIDGEKINIDYLAM